MQVTQVWGQVSSQVTQVSHVACPHRVWQVAQVAWLHCVKQVWQVAQVAWLHCV
jgi:hypothetical protein